MFAIGGEGVMRCGRHDLAIRDGSLVITAPGETHDTSGMDGVSRWGLDFTPDALGAEVAGWLYPRPSRPEWVALLRRSSPRASRIDRRANGAAQRLVLRRSATWSSASSPSPELRLPRDRALRRSRRC